MDRGTSCELEDVKLMGEFSARLWEYCLAEWNVLRDDCLLAKFEKFLTQRGPWRGPDTDMYPEIQAAFAANLYSDGMFITPKILPVPYLMDESWYWYLRLGDNSWVIWC